MYVGRKEARKEGGRKKRGKKRGREKERVTASFPRMTYEQEFATLFFSSNGPQTPPAQT